ncbi:MAG: hypothetical protein LH647_10005, partial [Leptolyngbyaceae cyanobacterium CAN_BIN12]|nr:hypothetical protein [Leptolyngbyaceae cyanobacterium CAN_BIN12]
MRSPSGGKPTGCQLPLAKAFWSSGLVSASIAIASVTFSGETTSFSVDSAVAIEALNSFSSAPRAISKSLQSPCVY